MKQKSTTLGKQILSQYQFLPYTPYPVPIKKARKSRIYDYDGNLYIDFYLHQGTILLGYKSQKLSHLINNRLSMGYFSGFYHHLYHRAKTSLQQLFSLPEQNIEFEVLFFTSEETRTVFLGSYPKQYSYLSVQERNKITAEHIFALDLSISNGYPIYVLLFPKIWEITNYTLSLSHTPMAFESIITTLHILQKKSLAIHTKEILSPFAQYILQQESHFFTLKMEMFPQIQSQKWENIPILMQKNGIMIDPQEPKFYVCLETTKQDVKFLFALLKSFSAE